MDEGPDDGTHLRVLRLCSVFEVDALVTGAARFDPVGGMQNHTAALTGCLDDAGVTQTVVTSRLGGPRRVTRRGARTTVVRVGVPLPRLRQLWALAALPHVLRRSQRVDVVHAHQGEDVAALLLGRLAAAVHRCPLVVTVHCSTAHTVTGSTPRALVLRWVGGAVERSVLRRAQAVITLAERTAALVRGDGVRASAVRVIPSGFDPALFDPALFGPVLFDPALFDPALLSGDLVDAFPGVERPRIGYVGRLGAQKRPDLLVRAFTAMREEAALVLVGDGPLRPRVEALVRESGAAGRTTLRGFVEHSAVPGVLASLDVLVLPSAYEELGSVLVEAMASGLPVVAASVGGIPEVVVDGETGLLVPPGDVPSLAAALDRLVADPALRERLGSSARARSRRYAWPALAQRVLDTYRHVTHGHATDGSSTDGQALHEHAAHQPARG